MSGHYKAQLASVYACRCLVDESSCACKSVRVCMCVCARVWVYEHTHTHRGQKDELGDNETKDSV